MPPYDRDGQWYTDFRFNRQRYRLSLGPEVKTKKQAEREERRIRSELEASATTGPATTFPPAAFSGFARKWLDVWGPANLSPSTLNRYESICTHHLVPWFGDRELTTIGQLELEEFRAANMVVVSDRTGRKLSPKTVNEHVNVLRSMLGVAVEWKYLPSNPTAGISDLELPHQAFDFYTAAEAAAFLECCRLTEPAWFPVLTTGFRTGLRLGELFALERTDLDLYNRVVHVRRSVTRVADKEHEGRSAGVVTTPKSGRSRMIPMSAQLRDVLAVHRHVFGELVFPRALLERSPGSRPDTQAEGPWLTPRMVDRVLARVAKAAGLRKLRPHDMRHSFASQLVIRGVPLRVVQEYLGHSSITMTERYAHLAPVTTHRFVAVLDHVEEAFGHNLDTATGGPHGNDASNALEVVEDRGIEPLPEVGAGVHRDDDPHE